MGSTVSGSIPAEGGSGGELAREGGALGKAVGGADAAGARGNPAQEGEAEHEQGEKEAFAEKRLEIGGVELVGDSLRGKLRGLAGDVEPDKADGEEREVHQAREADGLREGLQGMVGSYYLFR